MEESLKIDEEYKKAFNLGYELAKELNLKSSMFKKPELDNGRMNAIEAGMSQFFEEFGKQKNQQNAHDLVNGKTKSKTDKNRGKGLDISP